MIAAIGGDGRPAGKHLAINGRSLDAQSIDAEGLLISLVVADGLNQGVIIVVERHMPLALFRSILVHRVHGPIAGHHGSRIDGIIVAIGIDGRPAGKHLAIDGRSLDVHRVSIERRLTGLVVANGLNQGSVVVIERHMPLTLLRSILEHRVHMQIGIHNHARFDGIIVAAGVDGRPAGKHLAINGRSLDIHRVSIERRGSTGIPDTVGVTVAILLVEMNRAILRLRLDGHALRRRVIGNSGRRGHGNKRGDSCRAGNCLLHKTHLGNP